jgi:hypothetical protein
MDRKKIREFVRQAHPKRDILPGSEYDQGPVASSDDRDVDAGNLRLSNWKKFGTPAQRAAAPAGSGASDAADPREKFRPRTLTGGTTTASARAASPQPATDAPLAGRYRETGKTGKIALERLKLSPQGTQGDASEESLDVLVDEEHGIIGESDSGPEKD